MNEEYKKIEQLIEELKTSGKIRLASSDFRYYSESVNADLLKKINGVKVAPSILSFYRQIDFINIRWYAAEDARLWFLDKDSDIVGGSLNIPSFAFLLETWVNKNSQSVIDPYKSLEEKDYQSLAEYLPFDILNGDGAVCFKVNNGVIKDELYLVSTGINGFIQELQTNCFDYLNKGFEYYFFGHWQEAFYMKNSGFKNQIEFYLPQLKIDFNLESK